jgi:hypothetical protein
MTLAVEGSPAAIAHHAYDTASADWVGPALASGIVVGEAEPVASVGTGVAELDGFAVGLGRGDGAGGLELGLAVLEASAPGHGSALGSGDGVEVGGVEAAEGSRWWRRLG